MVKHQCGAHTTIYGSALAILVPTFVAGLLAGGIRGAWVAWVSAFGLAAVSGWYFWPSVMKPAVRLLLLAGAMSAVATGGVLLFGRTDAEPEPTGPPRGPIRLTLTCSGIRSEMRPGERIDLVYAIDAGSSGLVGLGAALYDADGHDHFDWGF